ncbi:MAG TPA: type VI secretion system-associated FHA domain protein TagH [Reyranella sp.]|nr:type VI secretion system-associated FHA domain protein TagH [Reyranella sp.]
MTLKLVMIRCPDNVAPERREVRGGEFSIGRGRDNEWVIADPERHLSKRHCRLVYSVGDWELHDLSANGTFLNGASDPVGQGSAEKLRNGDRIKFGPYEIEVTIDEDAEGAAPDRGRSLASLRPDDVAMREPRASRSDIRHYDDAGNDARLPPSGSLLDVSNSPILPADFDPLAPNQEPFAGTQPDHAPALESAFRPPQPMAIIPDDWDVESPAAPRPQTARPTQPPLPQEVAAPAPPRPEPAPLPPAASDSGLAAAFLRGVGLSEANLADPEKTLERIGAALRATVNGLRQTLMARASIKDEFRIEQTMIRASGNNPLKFSLDDDDALATLLGTGRRSGMSPEEAIAEAFNDLRLHELATVSAMQEAVRVLLAQFEPDSVERKVASSALQIHPAQKKARAWDAFVQLHGTVTQALSDDFDSVFGKAFARAYEQAIEKLSSDGSSS